MSTGKRIKHYRDKAKWKLADLSLASGVDVGTISALEVRDSKRSQFFAPIANAFGLTVEQLANEELDYELRIPDLTTLGKITISPLIPASMQIVPGAPTDTRGVRDTKPLWPSSPKYDELTIAAIRIMQGLDNQQKFAMLAKMREFKQHLDPPRVGQAL